MRTSTPGSHLPPRNKRIARFTLLIITMSALLIVISKMRGSSRVISPVPDALATPPTQTVAPTRKPVLQMFTKSKNADQLRAAVKALADTKWKNYSVLVIGLNDNFVMGINEASIYDGASVNKIPILATLYHEASEGRVDFDKTITLQEKDRQDYGTGSIRYDPAGSVYSIKTLARLMIQKSDNTAAYILANYTLKLKQIQSYIESLGTTQTDMMENTTSNKDTSIVFTKIFQGAVANQALTQEMIGLMKDTDFEDRLPAQLPDEAAVYHKIGTGVGAVHDAGVVDNGKNRYYVGIFTSNITDEERTSAEVAEVSKIIYDFMK